MVQAVVFDIDGTLIDSVDLHAEAWQSAFRKFGKTVRFAEVRLQIGKGADQLLPVFFSPEEMAKFGQELEDYRSELYKKEYLPHVKAFPKVRELFERIRQDRKSIALASSAKGDELNTYKKVVRIEDLIEAASRGKGIRPGEVIASQLPLELPVYAGDVLELEIAQVGTLRSRVA